MKITTHIVLYSIRIFLMVFWLYVALDKLWDLPQFHSALLRQPFADGWADILFWLLPLTELVLAFLFIATYHPDSRHSEKRSDVGISNLSISLPYILSAFLLAIFSVYIALGTLHLYKERGCASVFSGLSWSWHLLINLLLLGISILGWYLTGPTAPIGRYSKNKRQVELFVQYLQVITVQVYRIVRCRFMVFKMRFAPFPGRPVLQ